MDYRIDIIAPTSPVVIINTLRTIILPHDSTITITRALSASGNAPITHRWFSGAFSPQATREILLDIIQEAINRGANITKPTNTQWEGWTKAQKKQEIESRLAAISAAFGVWIWLRDNKQSTDRSPALLLTAAGLKTIGKTPGN